MRNLIKGKISSKQNKILTLKVEKNRYSFLERCDPDKRCNVNEQRFITCGRDLFCILGVKKVSGVVRKN